MAVRLGLRFVACIREYEAVVGYMFELIFGPVAIASNVVGTDQFAPTV